MQQKVSVRVGVMIIILMALTAGAFIYKVDKYDMENLYQPVRNQVKKKKNQTACTMEAKLCADGTYVSRSGPNCEFATCSGESVVDTSKWQTYRNEKCEFEIKHPASWGEKALLRNDEGINLNKITESKAPDPRHVTIFCYNNISEDDYYATLTQEEKKTIKTLGDYIKKSIYRNIKEIIFSGEEAFLVDYPNPAGDNIKLEPTILSEHNGRTYKIEYDKSGEAYGNNTETNTILGTFRFTN